MIEITPDDTPEGHDDGHAFLLPRKHRYTGSSRGSAKSLGDPGDVPLIRGYRNPSGPPPCCTRSRAGHE
jgi:hypothetical protein